MKATWESSEWKDGYKEDYCNYEAVKYKPDDKHINNIEYVRQDIRKPVRERNCWVMIQSHSMAYSFWNMIIYINHDNTPSELNDIIKIYQTNRTDQKMLRSMQILHEQILLG